MKIAEISIRRPVFASMVILALVVFGSVSYRAIGVDLYPDIDVPIVTITVPYEGADPETVETEVTDVIEEAVNTISGIKKLRSESIEGLSQVFIEFELEEDVDVVSQDVRDKVASIRGELPLEIEPPIIEKLDLDAAPIMSIVLSGQASIRELTEYADKVVKKRIEGIAGVGNVRLVGGREREIRIWLRAGQLEARELSVQEVIAALQRENLEPPGGRVETGHREIVVKTKGKIEKVEDFRDLIIADRGGAPIRLGEIAFVEDGMEDFRSLARLEGLMAVSLQVRRQSGTNMLEVAGKVKQRLDQLRGELPGGYRLTIAQDLSVFVEESIHEAQGELIRGGILAVLVILLFLRSLRGSLVAAITIPTTIIATFTFIYAMGFTLNMMSMLALTVSVGMIIDDSIVVLENSHRHMEEGKPRMEAARAGISEIGFAVIATSLAIGAVFVPVAFMKGMVGRFFYEFGLTVAFAVAVSTFIAVTLSPMLCSRVLKVPKRHGRVFNLLERLFGRLEAAYFVTLRAALRHRWAVVCGALAVFVSTLAITPFLGKEFVPDPDEAQFNVQVETPVGTSIQTTGDVLAEIERRMRRLPGVRETFTTIGAGVEQRANVATLLAKLVPKDVRGLSQAQIMALAREQLADLKHLKISVENVPRISGGGFRMAPVQYNLQGSKLDELITLSDKLAGEMTKVPGIVDINTTFDAGKPQANVLIDRDKAADLGVSVQDLGTAVHALIGGRKVTTFEERGETYDVRIRLVEEDRDRTEAILGVPLRTKSGKLVELSNLARVDEATGPVQIDREDRSRQITVQANLEESKPLATALEEVQQIVDRIGLPQGVAGKVSGFGDIMEESFANINFSLVLAVVLIYMVLAAQFESLVHPFTVMLSLPLSVVGALGALAITGRTLNIFSMIGMIMLMGLVTKNAILLIDYTNQLRGRGMARDDAILKAGPIRLRPILMTALSTIAGMIPVTLGLGAGAEQRAPLGTCIVGGLVTSTVLTLVVIPVVYTLLDDLGAWLRRLVFAGEPAPAAEAPVPAPAAAFVPQPVAAAGSAGDTRWFSDDGETIRLPVGDEKLKKR